MQCSGGSSRDLSYDVPGNIRQVHLKHVKDKEVKLNDPSRPIHDYPIENIELQWGDGQFFSGKVK